LPRLACTIIFLFYASCIFGITGKHHVGQPFGEMGSSEPSTWANLKLQSSSSQSSK
jgi:hypothetical protein